MSSSSDLKKSLKRYLNGKCTPGEKALLEQWFDQVQARQPHSSALEDADEERLIRSLKNHPRFTSTASEKARDSKVPFLLRTSWKAAAIWIGLILTGVAGYLLYKDNTPKSIQQAIAFIEIQTRANQRQRLIMPDSSVIWLNSNSRLSYHPDFARHREIRLDGEAFFDVTHDPGHPFTVKAGRISTEVYGTAFNISAYANANQLQVALQRGKIGVRYDSIQPGKERILYPGELLVYDKHSHAVQFGLENTTDMGGWVYGKLAFKRVPLKEVLTQLENYYGIDFSYTSDLKNVLITGQFEHASPEKIMKHLSFGWDIQFDRSGDTVYVK